MTNLAPVGLWAQTAPTHQTWPVLEGQIDADVVVVGGGFTGVSAAYHAALAGAKVVLLEARTIGFGGSGRNVGLVNAGLWTPPDEVEGKLGKEAGSKLNSYLAGGPSAVFDLIKKHQIQCEATREGTLHCAHSPSGFKDLENRYAQQIARNAPVKLLDAEETEKRTGSSSYFGSLWDARAGTIQPLAYVQGLARAAAAQGVSIFENTSALSLKQTLGGWDITTDHGKVSAAKLIQATNAYGVDGAKDNAIIPAHYFQLATTPLPQELRNKILAGKEGCWDTALIMSSFRMDQSGRLIFGGLGNLEGVGRRAHQNWAQRKARKLFPELANIQFEHEWTGRIAMTSTYLPRIESRGPNGISIFGYSGRGISPGTLFGRAAASWATGYPDLPIEITSPASEPGSLAKGAYYEFGSIMTHLLNGRI